MKKGNVFDHRYRQTHARNSYAFEHLSFVVPPDRDRNPTRMLEQFHETCLHAAHLIAKLILTQMDQLWSYQSNMTLSQSKHVVDSTRSLIVGIFAEQKPLSNHNKVLASAATGQAVQS